MRTFLESVSGFSERPHTAERSGRHERFERRRIQSEANATNSELVGFCFGTVGSRKKEYQLTDLGRRVLEAEYARLKELVAHGKSVLEAEDGE